MLHHSEAAKNALPEMVRTQFHWALHYNTRKVQRQIVDTLPLVYSYLATPIMRAIITAQ